MINITGKIREIRSISFSGLQSILPKLLFFIIANITLIFRVCDNANISFKKQKGDPIIPLGQF